MPRRKKRKKSPVFLKIFLWLCLAFAAVYYLVHLFIIQPNIIYPEFGISIPKGYKIHGIDVSRYQKNINWQQVKEMNIKGIQLKFAFIKATEGTDYVDPLFSRNRMEANKNNLPSGAYHFYIPGKNPVRQAKNFIQIAQLKTGDLPPVLDIEINNNLSVVQMRKEVQTWLDIVESEYGVKPILYTNISFYQKYFQKGFEEYPLWIAHYLQPVKPRIERDWIFWQHSETGNVNGIKGKVDFNIFYGDSTDFDLLLIP